ncbi:MAG: HalD/BesD family halogenase [Microthrixaceae bacterium]
MQAEALVDLERYPVLDLDGSGAAMADEHARALRDTGVAILPGFIRAEALPDLVAECERLAVGAYLQDVQGTPYLEAPDATAWPAGHPRVTWARSAVRTVAYDRFHPTTSGLRSLFEWDPLLALVARILGRSPLHRYADPLGAMNLAVMRAGDALGWHFDQTDFVVSLAIQASDAGGEFENVQRLRWREGGGIDEQYDTVARVLAGEAPELVTTVPMTPGTLMVFEGRWSLHRVTPVVGPTTRHVALFGYDTKPGTMSSELLKSFRYGRTQPEPLPA